MSTLTIKIVTPKSIAFEGSSDMITGPGFNGEFGVLPNHAQFLTLNDPGLNIGPLDSMISETKALSALAHSHAVDKVLTLFELIWFNAEYFEEPLSPP